MKRILLLLFILVTATTHSSATLRGGEITYKALGNNLYRVSLVTFKDCTGSQITPILKCMVGADTIFADSQVHISTADVSGIGPFCPENSKCEGNSSSQFGVQRIEWYAYFNLDTHSICQVKFFAQACCRNPATSTFQANDFFIEATFDQCLAPNSSSPVFQHIPEFYLCQNQDQSLSFFAYDSAMSADSVSYHFAAAKKENGSPVSYHNGYSFHAWCTFWGFPNANLPWPLGIHLDPVSAELIVRLTKINENPTGVVEVKQYKRINGVMTYVGSIYRETMLTVISCPTNKIPKVNPNTSTHPVSGIVCAGDKVCLPIITNDDDTDDTVRIYWNSGIPGAIFTHNNGMVKHASGEVCWTPDSSYISNIPYTFIITGEDDNCPLSGKVARAFSIYVKEKPAATPAITYNGCGNVQAHAQPAKNYASGVYTWTVKDSSGNVYGIHNGENPILKVPSGKVYVSLSLNLGGCNFSYTDSLVVPYYLDSLPKVYLPSDTAYCHGTAFSLTAGTSPLYTYNWNTGESTATIVATAGSYQVEVSNQFGCTTTRNVTVKEHPAPKPAISTFKGCAGDTVHFYDSAAVALVFSINWSDGFTGHPYKTSDSGMITNQVVSTSGCLFSDTLLADIAKAPGAKIQYQVKEDTVFFTTDKDSAKWIYTWHFGDGTMAMGRNQVKHYLANGSYPITLNIEEKHCMSTDTTTILLNVSVGEIRGTSLVVYPNPFLSQLNIELKADCNESVLVNLHDMAGKLVFEETVNTPAEPELHLDLSSADLSPGVYYLSLGCGENVYRQKVVKE